MNFDQPKKENQDNNESKKTPESKVKEGVDFVFEQNPELVKIGTKEQYSKYLDTIFPESKVKDIVYHGTNSENIDKFNVGTGAHGKGIYFQTSHGQYFTGTFGKNIIPVILNVRNPYIFHSNFKGTDGDLPELWIDLREQHRKNNTLEELADHFNNEIKKSGYDSLTIQMADASTIGKDDFYHLVFEPEQIHILNSNQDIEKFKEYISKNKEE